MTGAEGREGSEDIFFFFFSERKRERWEERGAEGDKEIEF